MDVDANELAAALADAWDAARTAGVSFSLTWSEGDELWYASAEGPGKREFWEVKRLSDPVYTLREIAAAIREGVEP